MTEFVAVRAERCGPEKSEEVGEEMKSIKPCIGATGYSAGEKSARRGSEPVVRLRTRHLAGDLLADLAPRSATWSHPV